MAGEGSTQAMISSLKNNRLLLSDRNFLNGRSGSFDKVRKTKLSFVTVTSEELEAQKKEIIKSARRQRIQNKIIASLVIVLVLLGLFYLRTLYKDHVEDIQHEVAVRRKKEFNKYIKEGDIFYTKEQWKNANFFYKRALTIFPKNQEVLEKIQNSYKNRCYNLGLDCNKLVR